MTSEIKVNSYPGFVYLENKNKKAEFMRRSRLNGRNLFEVIFKDITAFWPPN